MKIYDKYDDVHVKAVIVYTDSEHVAYHDAECTKPFTPEELKDAFLNGAFVSKDFATGDGMIAATACITESDGCKIHGTDADGQAVQAIAKNPTEA